MFTYLSLIKRGGGGRLFEAGHLFEVGTNSRLGSYSKKYCNLRLTCHSHFNNLSKFGTSGRINRVK